jgi:hypothetical protein
VAGVSPNRLGARSAIATIKAHAKSNLMGLVASPCGDASSPVGKGAQLGCLLNFTARKEMSICPLR